MNRDVELEDLSRRIEESVSRVSAKEIIVRPERIRKFCEIIEERNPIYVDLQAAKKAGFHKIPLPDSYLLTFLTPISHELFTTGIGHLVGTVIKGIIHTSSVIEFIQPLYCDTPYHLKLEFTELERKKGKMGEYFVGTFPHRIVDVRDRLMAIDTHVFFLRTT